MPVSERTFTFWAGGAAAALDPDPDRDRLDDVGYGPRDVAAPPIDELGRAGLRLRAAGEDHDGRDEHPGDEQRRDGPDRERDGAADVRAARGRGGREPFVATRP